MKQDAAKRRDTVSLSLIAVQSAIHNYRKCSVKPAKEFINTKNHFDFEAGVNTNSSLDSESSAETDSEVETNENPIHSQAYADSKVFDTPVLKINDISKESISNDDLLASTKFVSTTPKNPDLERKTNVFFDTNVIKGETGSTRRASMKCIPKLDVQNLQRLLEDKLDVKNLFSRSVNKEVMTDKVENA